MYTIETHRDIVLTSAFLSLVGGVAIKRSCTQLFPECQNPNLTSIVGAVFILKLAPPCIDMALKSYRYLPPTFNNTARIVFVAFLLPAAMCCIYLYRKKEQSIPADQGINAQKQSSDVTSDKEKEIPEKWHNDPLLSQFTCPLSGAPISVPIKDPKANVLYDQPWITKWFKKNQTSPFTREKMTIFDLFHKNRPLYSLIQYRLEQLKQIEKSGKNNTQVLMNASAAALLKEVRELLNLTVETLSSLLVFPEFLQSNKKCLLTGKSIRFLLVPNIPELEMTENELEIYYEKTAILNHIENQPNVAPPGWPIARLPLPLSLDSIRESRSIQNEINKNLLEAIKELITCYPDTIKQETVSEKDDGDGSKQVKP